MPNIKEKQTGRIFKICPDERNFYQGDGRYTIFSSLPVLGNRIMRVDGLNGKTECPLGPYVPGFRLTSPTSLNTTKGFARREGMDW